MILQELAHYYWRVSQAPGAEAAVAQEGFEWRRIPFVIVLNGNGKAIALEDTRHGEAAEKNGTLFMVPKGVKKTSGLSANLLWDNPSYLLARPKLGLRKVSHIAEAQAKERQRLFIEQIRERLPNLIEDPGIKAVLQFLETGDYQRIFTDAAWPDIERNSCNLTFRLDGDACLVCQRPAVVATISANSKGVPWGPAAHTCLVTGASTAPVRIHSAIRGVRGSLRSGANIVSFAHDAFCSFGKNQGENAPIGKHAEFAYTTGLNMLLASPQHRLRIGDASAVFWSDNPALERACADLFNGSPEAVRGAIRSLFNLAQSRQPHDCTETGRFFLLALAPNVARLAIRLWYQGIVTDTALNIVKHVADCNIAHDNQQPEYTSLLHLLASTASPGKEEHIESQMACDTMRSILTGSPYPRSLLRAILRRCRTEHTVSYPQASLLKGIVVQQARSRGNEATVGARLDPRNGATGYLLGRLFSLAEQSRSIATRSTAHDHLYGAASTRPAAFFPQVLKRQNHYLGRIWNRGLASRIKADSIGILRRVGQYPLNLPEDDQALFALGYYHQLHADLYFDQEIANEHPHLQPL